MSDIFLGLGGNGENQHLALSRSNRHGLIAGATGTGKTVTLQGLAESFSHIELPAFLTATPETDAHQLARLMLAHHLDAALLIDRDGTAIGIVTGTDFLRLYAEASRHEGSV